MRFSKKRINVCSLLEETKMLIFVSIAFAAFFIVAGAFLFGHDHDIGHDASHDVGPNEPTISIFSAKVIFTMIMGFGAAGAIARYYDASYVASSGIGVVFGLILAALMYFILEMIYKQQASSSLSVSSLIGSSGSVTVSIDKNSVGEVSILSKGQYNVQPAISANGEAIGRMSSVKVINVAGGKLVVEKISSEVPAR
jgi:membrane-bound ClpP family serine protease